MLFHYINWKVFSNNFNNLMKVFIAFFVLFTSIIFSYCITGNHSNGNLLSRADFEQKIVELPDGPYADDNPQLCKELDVGSLPSLFLYKNKILTWETRGYLEKADMVKALQ